MIKLFKQNPTVEKYKPDSTLRQMESLDIDRKKDLERFRVWMEGTAKEKSELPDQGELDELNKQATKGSGAGMGMLGAIAAIGAGGFAFSALGGMDGISSMVSDAMSFITGGGVKTSTGSGDDILGLKSNEQSKGFLDKLFGGFGGSSTSSESSTPLLPTPPTIPSTTLTSVRPTAVVATGTNSYENPNQAEADVASTIKELQGKGYRVVIVPPDSESSQFSPVHDAVVRAAQAHGATIETGQYGGDTGKDRSHLTPGSADAIRQKYAGATVIGDSNAIRIGGSGAGRVRGAGTGAISQYAQNLPSAKTAPAPSSSTPLAPRRPSAIDQSSLPALPPTGTGGSSLAAAQQYGASRDGGNRRHAGQDFDAPPNGTFYSRIGGEVLYAANAGGGYGNVVDIYNKQLGVTERIAEGDRNLVSEGDMVQAGTPVQRGTAQTGVFHYEIRKGKAGASGSFQGTMDPIKFLNNLPQDLQQVEPGEETPNTSGQTKKQQGFNLIQQMTKMLEPLAPMLKLFEYMNDKELMDKTVIYGRDPETGLPIPNFKPVKPAPVKQDMVSMFTQSAEQAQGDFVIIQGGQTIVPSGESAGAPSPNIQMSGGSANTIVIGGGNNFPHIYKGLMATKLKNN